MNWPVQQLLNDLDIYSRQINNQLKKNQILTL